MKEAAGICGSLFGIRTERGSLLFIRFSVYGQDHLVGDGFGLAHYHVVVGIDVDDPGAQLQRSFGLQADVVRFDHKIPAADGDGAGGVDPVVIRVDIERAARDVHIAQSRVLGVCGLHAVPAALEVEDAAADDHIVPALYGVMLGVDRQIAALHGQRIGGADAVVAVPVYHELAGVRAADKQRAFGVNGSVRRAFKHAVRSALLRSEQLGIRMVVGNDVLGVGGQADDGHGGFHDADRRVGGAAQLQTGQIQIDRLSVCDVDDDLTFLRGTADVIGSGAGDRDRGSVNGHVFACGSDRIARKNNLRSFLLFAARKEQKQGKEQQIT